MKIKTISHYSDDKVLSGTLWLLFAFAQGLALAAIITERLWFALSAAIILSALYVGVHLAPLIVRKD